MNRNDKLSRASVSVADSDDSGVALSTRWLIAQGHLKDTDATGDGDNIDQDMMQKQDKNRSVIQDQKRKQDIVQSHGI